MSRRLIDDTHDMTEGELSELIWARFETLREAGEVLGIDRTQLCKLTTGNRPISINTADAIRARLDRFDAKQRRRRPKKRNA